MTCTLAALFLAQAAGMDLSLAQQIGVVLASVMAAVGVAGVPEAGLIARCRSGVNVMSDMLVGILLDATSCSTPRPAGCASRIQNPSW
ncbi:MAG: cation:dicarboxylase symporter family transporter [Armatimonadetes bacterium]|nr:cation:dicarboxylase symporter family transporter [Armatimonadota bacterium]